MQRNIFLSMKTFTLDQEMFPLYENVFQTSRMFARVVKWFLSMKNFVVDGGIFSQCTKIVMSNEKCSLE